MTLRTGALVTGGSSGIGFGIARALVQSGADVVIVGRGQPAIDAACNMLRADAEFGQTVQGIQCDVSDESQLQDLFGRLPTVLPNFSLLVANAGFGRVQPFLETDSGYLREVVALNVVGTFLCCQLAARLLVKLSPPNPNIVVTSSIRADGPRVGRAAYSATKAAVNQMVRIAALELAPLGIRVNAVAPGITETPLAAQNGTTANAHNEIPLARPAYVEDVAQAVLFLASGAASFITGTVQPVDGGESLR